VITVYEFTLKPITVKPKHSLLRRLKSGEIIRLGNYHLQLFTLSSGVKGVRIAPIPKKVIAFSKINGKPVQRVEFDRYPRLRVAITYFDWEIRRELFLSNSRLPKLIKDFLRGLADVI